MKIIYVTTESLIDHSFTITSEIKKHIDLKTYIIAKDESEEINQFCNKLGAVFVKRLRFSNPLSLFHELSFLNRLRKQKCDLIWFNTFSVYQALFVKLFIKKFLVNTHDAELHPEEKDFHGIFARWLTFKLYKKKVCLVSKTQASVFEKRIGLKPRVFRLPIIDYYQASAKERNLVCEDPESSGDKAIPNVKTELSGQNKPLKFFFFGTILPYKGIELLLDAVEILRRKGLQYEFSIYGKLMYDEKTLFARIQKLTYIHHRNEFITYGEVYNTFARNDVIVLPYIQVTQCGPLLIAYNQNIPAICNDTPGFSEYVDDGKSGFLFNGSDEDLAKKMEYLINNPPLVNEMKKYIKENITKKFSISALAPEYIHNFQT